MDIKNLQNNIVSSRSNEAVKNTGKDVSEKTTGESTSASLDKVTITQTFSQITSLEQKARNVEIDNSSRIAELKAAIQDGSYKVDAERVAEKLMQTEALFARF